MDKQELLRNIRDEIEAFGEKKSICSMDRYSAG